MECPVTHDAVLYKVAEVSGVVDSSGAHAELEYPLYVLLDFNPAKEHARVMSGAAETPD